VDYIVILCIFFILRNIFVANTVALMSIGCRTNQEEMSTLRAELLADGYSIVDEAADAGIIIVNTCSVTSFTESKTKRLINSLSREAPNARILVTGCFAQQHGEALLKYANVAWVVGNGDKHKIVDIIKSTGGVYLSDINSGNNFFGDGAVLSPDESGRTRFSIKIQEGCDYRCAYCVVPSLRGPSRSVPADRLIDIFKRAVDKGYKEIVLTGTHIGQYQYGLESLLEKFLKISGDYRIRLSSLDPRDLTDSLAAEVGAGGRICDHLHVSVQSLCAGVLSRMDRPYSDIDALAARLRAFRAKYPYAGLGADFIVGHPGETDAMFEATLRGAAEIGFSYGHVFRYSKRGGTKSAQAPDQISEAVKTSRSAALRTALGESREKFLSGLFGRPFSIIVENKNPTRGVGGNYIKVEVPQTAAPKNSWMRVALLTGGVGYCTGKKLSDNAIIE